MDAFNELLCPVHYRFCVSFYDINILFSLTYTIYCVIMSSDGEMNSANVNHIKGLLEKQVC